MIMDCSESLSHLIELQAGLIIAVKPTLQNCH